MRVHEGQGAQDQKELGSHPSAAYLTRGPGHVPEVSELSGEEDG